MNFWLVKQEPTKYSWDEFVHDKETYWDGVRNYQARNNLKAMKKGDYAFYYHSVSDKKIMGIAKVTKEFYQDPTTPDERWVVVDLKPVKPFKNQVSLEQVKGEKSLQDIALVKQSRLSVAPLTQKEFKIILKMGGTDLTGI
jgi:predicted RNA-binding protein with PUA-like domain